MNSKLTLSLDTNVIERAKAYARKKNTSLSKMIETYLGHITSNTYPSDEIAPIVKSLSGVFEPPEEYNSKAEYKKHVLKKYSK